MLIRCNDNFYNENELCYIALHYKNHRILVTFHLGQATSHIEAEIKKDTLCTNESSEGKMWKACSRYAAEAIFVHFSLF